MGHDDATHFAAGIAYYFIFSLFPLLLGLLALAGIVFNSESFQQDFLDFITANLPGAAGFVERNVLGIVRLRGVLGASAIVGLLWSASAVFGAISRGVNRAWDIHQDRPFYIAKPRHLGMALAVMILFLCSTFLTTAVRLLTDSGLGILAQGLLVELNAGQLLLRMLSWLMVFGIFLLLYRFIPNCQTYWRYVWPGALIAATLFELGKNGFLWYLGTFANYSQIYGSLTSVILLLLWAYLSSLILMFGAETSSEFEKLYGGRATATTVERDRD
jgi:membrane protein